VPDYRGEIMVGSGCDNATFIGKMPVTSGEKRVEKKMKIVSVI